MTTYNTGNPIGSKDPRDLYDNAENLDEAVNTRTAESWDDRFGVARKTWHGMEQDFQQFLLDSGYVNIGDYAPGLEITARNQIFWRDGELYRASASLELPYTTTGDWGDEEGLFVAVGDAALRHEINSGVRRFRTLQEMALVDGRFEGDAALVERYSDGTVGGGGFFYWFTGNLSSEVSSDPYSVIYVPPLSDSSGSSGAWVRAEKKNFTDEMAGIISSDAIDQSDKLESLLNIVPENSNVFFNSRTILLDRAITCTNSINVFGGGVHLTIRGSVSFRGEIEEIGFLTEAATRNSRVVIISSSTSISRGDVIALLNDVEGSFNSSRPYYKDGEFCEVIAHRPEGTELKQPLMTEYPSGVNSKVYKINPWRGSIQDVVFEEDREAISGQQYCLVIRNGYKNKLLNVHCTGGDYSAMHLLNVFSCNVEQCSAFNDTPANPSATQYGISVLHSQDVVIRDSEFYGTRHANGVGGGQGVQITCRNIHFKNCILSSDKSLHAADFHGNAWGCSFIDCNVYGGYGVGGENIIIRGGICTPPELRNNPSAFTLLETVGGDFLFEGVTVDMNNTPYMGIIRYVDTTNALNTSKDMSVTLSDIFVHNEPSTPNTGLIFINSQTSSPSIFRRYSFRNINVMPNGFLGDRVASLSSTGGNFTGIKKVTFQDIDPGGAVHWINGTGVDQLLDNIWLEAPLLGSNKTLQTE